MLREGLVTAINNAKKIFKAIAADYPDLMPDILRPDLKRAYLVFSTPYGQCDITDNPLQILKEFSAMISESEYKSNVIKLLGTIKGLDAELKKVTRGNTNAEIKKKIENESTLLKANIEKLEFKDDTFIEIRFNRSILDQIFKMQKDSLVSQVHTPQTQASIRIVLGTLIELAQRVEKLGDNKGEHE